MTLPRTQRLARPSRPLAALCAAVALLAPLPAAAKQKVWVELQTPTEEQTVRSPVGLVEIKGWTGTGLRGGHDVLIAIDCSASVWDASGSDIDGDGIVGRNRKDIDLVLEFSRKSTDPDDTILRAQLAAARKLIQRMDPKTTRMGVMMFGGGAKVLAPIGSSTTDLLAALAEVPKTPDFGGTSFEKAFKLAGLQFEAQKRAKDPADRRNFSVILLSDGQPTAPGSEFEAKQFAIQAAQDAANKLGVRMYAFAIGPEAIRNQTVYEEITRKTGGELVLIDRPGDVIDFVPIMSLTKIARVQIDNLSSSEQARAVRLFPDGSFDGYAPLREGMNLIRITSVGEDGYERVIDRKIFFEKIEAKTDADNAEASQILRDLKVRTLETELAEDAKRKREAEKAGRNISIQAD